MYLTRYLTIFLSFLILISCASHNKNGATSDIGSNRISEAEANCLEISLTGTMGGPANYGSLAGSGTLVKYGTVANDCGQVHLQFDIGRATSVRLAELGVNVNDLDAVFITHLHSDHTIGLIDILQTRWHFFGQPVDMVCSGDQTVDGLHTRTMSCREFGNHIADAAIHAGEIAQRSSESNRRSEDGPASIVNFVEVPVPLPSLPEVVWSAGDVSVSAIGSRHIPGHLSYRVDTPAGSVVIGGDAGNDRSQPPREHSTSVAVELLADGADMLVHSTMHPVFDPKMGSSFPAPLFYRQSTAPDLAAMARRAGIDHLVMTHLIPVIGAAYHGPYEVPGGALTIADYESAVADSGYGGKVYVGRDLLTIRLPPEN